MHCAQHPGIPAVTTCNRCDQGVCAQCRQERAGKVFCPSCAEFLDRRAVARPGRPSGAHPLPAAESPPPNLPPLPTASSTGDLYEGPPLAAVPPPPPGGLYAPPAATGDLYVPPPPGQVHSGPTATTTAARTPGTTKPAATEGKLGPMLLFGILAGLLGAGIWFGIAAVTDYKVGFIAIILGTGVGIAAAYGAGGGGPVVALTAALLTAGSLLLGDYLIARHYYKEMVGEDVAASSEWQAQAAAWVADGQISDAELADYHEVDEEDLAEADPEELEAMRAEALDDLTAAANGADAEPALPFLAFWGILTGVKDLIFYAIGVASAWRLAMGKT